MVDTPSPARFSSSARLRADAEALRALHRPGDPLVPGPLGVALAALQRATGALSRARRSPRTCGSA